MKLRLTLNAYVPQKDLAQLIQDMGATRLLSSYTPHNTGGDIGYITRLALTATTGEHFLDGYLISQLLRSNGITHAQVRCDDPESVVDLDVYFEIMDFRRH